MPTSDPSQSPSPADQPDARQLIAERDAALRALRSAVRDTTRLTRLFTVLSEPDEPARTLDRVLATLSELFAADVVVLLKPVEGVRCTPLAAIGWPIASIDRVLSCGPGGPLTISLEKRAPVAVADVRSHPGVDPFIVELGAESAVFVPVCGDDATRGVLLLARCRPAPFAQPDVDLLAAMAYRIGQMLDRLHAEDERGQLEARLRQAEKAESLGRMAGAVAHHFNNMLAVIAGSLDLALLDLPADHASREDIARAQDACTRAAETSGLMLTYLGQSTVAREPVDLVAAVADALPALQASLPDTTTLTADLCEPGLIVMGSRSQIEQVLANVVVNAHEAIGDGPGVIAVTVRAVTRAQVPAVRFPSHDWEPIDENYVCVEVSDTGGGMSRETLAKIFDPFFTTKSIGRGLGLPAVQGIVRALGGGIVVRSTPGAGTSVSVYWPLSGQVPRQEAPSAEPVVASVGRKLVLVVDDEAMVREMMRRILTKLGFDVLVAADGAEAVEIFRRRQAELSLAILDLTMPGMDGWATLSAIRALRRDVPAILASGYDKTHAMGGDHAERPQAFLHKPFVVATLQAAIDRALAGSTPPSRDGTDSDLPFGDDVLPFPD